MCVCVCVCVCGCVRGNMRGRVCLCLCFLVMWSPLSPLVCCQDSHTHTHTHTHTRAHTRAPQTHCASVNSRLLAVSHVAFSPARKHTHLFTFPTTPAATVSFQDHRSMHVHVYTHTHTHTHTHWDTTQQAPLHCCRVCACVCVC